MTNFQAQIQAHFSTLEQSGKTELFNRVLETGSSFGNPAHVFWVPGRIEVLGKHTDYCGGRSLLAATTRGFFFAVYPRNDDTIGVVDAQSGDRFDSRLTKDVVPVVGHWSNYAETVFRRVGHNFEGGLRGADIVFGSDLPQAAGMSSSSAMIVGFFLVLDAVNDLKNRIEYKENIQTPEDLAGYLGTNENGQTFGTLVGDKGVGTFGGSEDHTAILNCKAGSLSQYRYCPVVFERDMALPSGFVFAIGASGVVAEKTGAAMAKYNRASRLAFETLAVWNLASKSNDPTLAEAIKEAGRDAIRSCLENATHKEFSSEEMVQRFDHFYCESEEILPEAGDALGRGDLEAFGEWVDKSQHAGVKLLRNQVPETEALASLARANGAVAASAFGAGFGGSVWALVEEKQSTEFLDSWRDEYMARFPIAGEKSQFFKVEAGRGAFELGATL